MGTIAEASATMGNGLVLALLPPHEACRSVMQHISRGINIFCIGLTVKFPRCTLFTIFYFESECRKLVAYAVAGGPIFCCFCCLTLRKKHVDYFTKGLFAPGVIAALLFKTEDVKCKQVECLFKFFKVGTVYRGFLVGYLINGS